MLEGDCFVESYFIEKSEDTLVAPSFSTILFLMNNSVSKC